MISICIPVYNLEVTELVSALFEQSKQLKIASEIILIDDASKDIFKEQNKLIKPDVTYIELEKNIGRAAIRNLFLEHAKYDFLLFLDCDSTILKQDFLNRYIDAVKKYPDCVICGGSEYQKNPPSKNKQLRWKYGVKRESKPIEARLKDNYHSFLTNNFIISRKGFETVKFDENLLNYGHEDTLFGIELKNAGIKILHIDNAVLNGNLSDNIDFINHTEQAIHNLIYILRNAEDSEAIKNNISLMRAYYKFYKVRGIVLPVFTILAPLIKSLLKNGYVNLYLFDFYKLGILSRELDGQQY